MARTTVDTATRVRTLLELLLGGDPIPFAIQAWDGSASPPPDDDQSAPTLVVSNRRALRRLLWDPTEMGAARAFVAGELDVRGDLVEALDRLVTTDRLDGRPRLEPVQRAELARLSVLLGAVGPSPRALDEEAALSGDPHSPSRDRAVARFRDDFGAEFFRMVLGPSMVRSPGRWSATGSLEEAQRVRLDEVCQLLALKPGMRLLDMGCGFGTLVEHAVARYGVTAVGVTTSDRQAASARERASTAGLGDAVQIRTQDYRTVDDGPFDAIASLGFVEHVGSAQMLDYTASVHALLRPGAVSVHEHVVSRRSKASFAQAFVEPDVHAPRLAAMVAGFEDVDLEVLSLTNLASHDEATLRAWSHNLQVSWPAVVATVGANRARAWRLHLAAETLASQRHARGYVQIVVRRPRARVG